MPKIAVTKQNTSINQEHQKSNAPQVETLKSSTSETIAFDVTNVLSQMKIFVPLLEMMKIPEYKNSTMTLISEVSFGLNKIRHEKKDKSVDSGENKQPSEIYLGTTLHDDPSRVDPFYLTLLINNKVMKNCMIDIGATINVMPLGVMKELGLEVDDNYGTCYAMDNRSVPVVGVLKDLEIKIASYREDTYKIDITVIDVPPSYGMLLSR